MSENGMEQVLFGSSSEESDADNSSGVARHRGKRKEMSGMAMKDVHLLSSGVEQEFGELDDLSDSYTDEHPLLLPDEQTDGKSNTSLVGYHVRMVLTIDR